MEEGELAWLRSLDVRTGTKEGFGSCKSVGSMNASMKRCVPLVATSLARSAGLRGRHGASVVSGARGFVASVAQRAAFERVGRTEPGQGLVEASSAEQRLKEQRLVAIRELAAVFEALTFVQGSAHSQLVQQQQQRPVFEQEKVPLVPIFEGVKREYQPNFLRRKRNHGFLKRSRKASGRRILNRRKAKGRKRLSA